MASIKPGKVDAVYELTIPGYGVRRYWSEKIAGMPREVLTRKHFVYYELESPEKAVSVYDGARWLDDASPLESLPFREEGGKGAAAHVEKKNAWPKPKKDALEAVKAAPEVPKLPDVAHLSALPLPIHTVTIEDSRKPKPGIEPAWEDPLTPTGNPGEFIDKATGKIYRERPRDIPRASAPTDADEERLAELERKTREKKLSQRPEYMKTMADN